MSVSSSRAEERTRQIKELATLELYLREGSFWEAIRATRSKWEITPVTELPPADLPVPRPNEDPFDARYDQWPSDVKRLSLRLGRKRFYRAADWERFAAACVLYNPPETREGRDLLTFAEYGGVNAQPADGRNILGESIDGESARVVAPLVKWVPNQAQSQLKIQRYFEAIIDELVRRYVEPTGKDGAEALHEIVREGGLEELLAAPVDRVPAIFPDEYSTKPEVLAAHNAIRSNRGGDRINGLVAVICAILQDDHNSTDLLDRRRKRYTQETLAREFKLKNKNSAREYVKLGRELRLSRKKNLQES